MIACAEHGSSGVVASLVGEFARHLNARVVQCTHEGASAARNAAIEHARSPLIVLYAADLRPSPELVQYCVDFHRRHPGEEDLALLPFVPDEAVTRSAFGRWLFVGGGLNGWPETPGVHSWRQFRAKAISCRRSIFRHASFDETYLALEDIELGCRLSTHLPLRIHVAERPLSTFSGHPVVDDHVRREYLRGYFLHRLVIEHPEARALTEGLSLPSEEDAAGDRATVASLLETARRLETSLGPNWPDIDPARFQLLCRLWRAALQNAVASGYSDARAGRWLGASLAKTAAAGVVRKPRKRRPGVGRAHKFLTIGICTVSTRPRNYLRDTLASICDGIPRHERDEVRVVILDCDIAPANPAYMHEVRRIFAAELGRGFITIERVDPSRYPSFENLPDYLGDGRDHVRWRAKFTYDFALLMERCRGLAQYYLHLEDDVRCVRGFYGEIKRFIGSRIEPWAMISFSDFGFVGKCFRDADLAKVSTLFKTYFAEAPGDWLIEHHLDIMRRTSRHLVQFPRSLFDHVGIQSSLPGKLQYVRSRTFTA